MLREYEGTLRFKAALGFNGHPPLGVNATELVFETNSVGWRGFNGHPPLGVNATLCRGLTQQRTHRLVVSMGTHPWG